MKKHILLIISLFASFAVFAQQDTMYFFRGEKWAAPDDNIFLKIAVKDVDTMKFNATLDSLKIFKKGGVMNVATADVDSITFALDTCPDCGLGRMEGVPLLGYGVPQDQRVKARQHIQAVRDSMLAKGYPHDYAYWGWYSVWQEIALCYPDDYRTYEQAKLKGFQGDYLSFINGIGKDHAYDFLSDTVVIYMGGGPDYGLGTERPMVLYHAKHKDSAINWNYDDYDYIPISNTVLDRKYNLTHTSIIQVPHATAGNIQYYSFAGFSIRFFDFYQAGNRGELPWPYNQASYEELGLVNDIGVELIRYTVEKLKSMHKTIVYWGGSWGALTMARYLLYYPIEDFAQVNLIGFNPNVPKEIIRRDRSFFDSNIGYEQGIVEIGSETYEMLRWRMLPWLTRQNLDRLRIITGGDDERLGFPKPNEIDSLTAQGATVVKVVGAGHSFIEADEEQQSWENNLVIYTKNGVEVISPPEITRTAKVKRAKDVEEKPVVSDKFRIKVQKLEMLKKEE